MSWGNQYKPHYNPPAGYFGSSFSFPQPQGSFNNLGYFPSPSYVPPSGPPPPSNAYPSPAGHTAPYHSSTSADYGQHAPPSYESHIDHNEQGWQQNNQNHPGDSSINWGTHSPAIGDDHMPPSHQEIYGPTQNNNDPRIHFQYSLCTGRKRALLIGVNYFGQRCELQSCINDSNNMYDFLTRQFGYKRDDIIQLVDDATDPGKMPTRDNILQAMRWLVKDAQPNDSLFFHYSGHGGQTKDLDGDEADGYDEVIYPMDFEYFGHIVDDDMHAIMVKPLPPGCRLTAVFDSDHSGSALDLPYMYSTGGMIKLPDAGPGICGMMRNMGSFIKSTAGQRTVHDYARQMRSSPADVISWSACKDSEIAADTVEAGAATGAMTYAFIEVLKQNPLQTYQELLNNLRGVLNNHNQKPQLSSSHPMDPTMLFVA